MGSTHTRIHIGHVIRDAVQSDIKKWFINPMNTDSLPQIVSRLFALLAERQIEYVLVGGLALLNYVEGRNTEDIDLIMAVSSLAKMPEIEVSSQDMYFAHGRFDELKIDILLTNNPLFEKVRCEYTSTQHFVEHEIPTATVEGLLLLKLYALPSLYRQGSFSRVSIYENDIATLVHDFQPDLGQLLAELSQYLGESDLKELQNITNEIMQRIERFRKGSAH
jgi:hypothetical protein